MKWSYKTLPFHFQHFCEGFEHESSWARFKQYTKKYKSSLQQILKYGLIYLENLWSDFKRKFLLSALLYQENVHNIPEHHYLHFLDMPYFIQSLLLFQRKMTVFCHDNKVKSWICLLWFLLIISKTTHWIV